MPMPRYVKEFAKDVTECINDYIVAADNPIYEDYVKDIDRTVRGCERGLIANYDAVDSILKTYKAFRRLAIKEV